jgi:hypothetical protein
MTVYRLKPFNRVNEEMWAILKSSQTLKTFILRELEEFLLVDMKLGNTLICNMC